MRVIAYSPLPLRYRHQAGGMYIFFPSPISAGAVVMRLPRLQILGIAQMII
jgi:hypothetical protein